MRKLHCIVDEHTIFLSGAVGWTGVYTVQCPVTNKQYDVMAVITYNNFAVEKFSVAYDYCPCCGRKLKWKEMLPERGATIRW